MVGAYEQHTKAARITSVALSPMRTRRDTDWVLDVVVARMADTGILRAAEGLGECVDNGVLQGRVVDDV